MNVFRPYYYKPDFHFSSCVFCNILLLCIFHLSCLTEHDLNIANDIDFPKSDAWQIYQKEILFSNNLNFILSTKKIALARSQRHVK